MMYTGMKKYFLPMFSSIILLVFFVQTVTAEEKIDALPKPKIELFSESYIAIPHNVELKWTKSFYVKYKAAFDSLQQTLRKNTHAVPGRLHLLFELAKIKDISVIDRQYRNIINKPESYMIVLRADKITVMSLDDQGLLNGLSTLEALIEKYAGKLPLGRIVDYPDTKMRILHLSLWPCETEDFKKAIRLARIGHYNGLIWLNHYGVKLHSLKHLQTKSNKQWSIEEFKQMIRFAKENGLEVIPELKLLSHQKQFIKNNHPEFLYNKMTYDPGKKELYGKVVFPGIDEILALTGATKFHIGHDEVLGWSENHYKKGLLKMEERQLPPELFLQDVLMLHDYLRSKGVETWMWSDMLYTKEEFPSMKKAGANLNGMNGYAALRDRLPKDIIMCVWHYRGNQKEFLTAQALAANGYKVLGATWKDRETTENFSKYINELPNNAQGMIATTWYGLGGDTQKEVFDIIKFSAEAFWNAK